MLFTGVGRALQGETVTETGELMEKAVAVALKERVRLKRGDNLVVETYPHGLELAREAVHQARAMGAHPMLLMEDEAALFRSVESLKPGAQKLGSHEWAALGKANAYVFIPGPADLPRVWGLGPKWGAAFPSNGEWYARAAKAKIRGVRLLYGYTSAERAQAYGLDLGAWRQMVLEAAAVSPKTVRPKGARLASILKKGKEVQITAANGTDLHLHLAGRDAQVDDGSVSAQDLKDGENMTQAPAGQLWVAPDEKSAQGTIVFDRPALTLGRPLRGVSFEFEGGKLVSSSFAENGDVFERAFARAKGDKDRVGMLIFGLNPKVRPGFPQDPMAAGVVTLTLGYNDELGGKNKTEFQLLAPHASATVVVDGKTVVDAGRLAV